MPDHKGHRERVRQRYRTEGLDGFQEKQALELLLYYAIPRCDTEPIAGALLEYFGSLEGVMEAPVPALAKVPGMGESAATFLRLIADFNRYQMVHKNKSVKILDTVARCGEHLRPHFLGRRDEVICILCLDARCKMLSCKVLSEGNQNSTGVPIRKIVEYALAVNATSLVMAHNHPSGIALPSADDLDATGQLAAALASVDVLLADHLIFADDDFISLAESGFYTPG